ncbi:MAG: FAD-binding oxidoreductase [Gemmatimonadaceae bacterium]
MTSATSDTALAPRDTSDVCDIVRESASLRRSLRIVGAGTWLDAGRAVRGATHLSLSSLSDIVEYVPGDLTLTARAGTPLSEIVRLTSANGQWLPLDPFGDPGATLGATLATASCGPLAGTMGRPRDVALGLALVTGEGNHVQGGGRVVKNVAGFDLVRLNVGAWGTLGVITEATVRLRALPACDSTVALAAPTDMSSLHALIVSMRNALLTPMAMELVSASLASRIGRPPNSVILVRIAGNEESMRAQRATLSSLGPVADVDTSIWDRLRATEPARSATFRISRRPSELAALWSRSLDVLATHEDALLHANVERGVVRAILPESAPSDLSFTLMQLRQSGSLIGERLPEACWASLGADFSNALAHSARRAFDPAGILNPGIVAPAP